MFVTAEELIGINSLTDGRKIWGFYETVPGDVKKYAGGAAEKLAERGKEEVSLLAAVLRKYKSAERYLVINSVNAAKTEQGWIVLFRRGKEYCLQPLADGTFCSVLKEQLLTDARKEIHSEAEKIEPEDFAGNYTDGIENYTVIYRYDKGTVADFELIYKKQGKTYLYDLINQKHEEADNRKIGNRIRRYTREWSRKTAWAGK